MIDTAINSENDKVKRLINSGIKEFSEYGIKASLNDILKNAQMSKGGFYHYFKKKEEFYDYLIWYTIKNLTNFFKNNIDVSNSDLLKRMEIISLYEVDLMVENPYIMKFFSRADGVKLHNIYGEYFMDSDNIMMYMYGNIDDTLLRDDIEAVDLINHINMVIYGITEKNAKLFIESNNFDIENIKKEIKDAFVFLRIGYYK